MTTEAATYQRRLRKQGTWHRAFTRPNYLARLRDVVGKTDWDEVIPAREEWINRMCIAVTIVAALYFVPPVLTILFLR